MNFSQTKPGQRLFWMAFTAALLTLLLYLPALFCDFVNWDDPLYILENPAIRLLDLQFASEAFTTSYMGWWMPLTWISFAIDYYFWELNPFGYHLTNVLFHAANTGLVVLVADELLFEGQGSRVKVQGLEGAGKGAWGERGDFGVGWGGYVYPASLLFAALLWGLHPLRVESVAWVTERKDVLNGFFSLATILCYLRYARGRGAAGLSGRVIRYYLLSLFFLLLSLMSKPVSVVIPAMLLVADWYPLKRFQKWRGGQILLEKVPFVILVAVLSFITIHFAAGNQILVSYQDFPLSSRFLLAGHSLFEYCRMTLYPVDIIHIYLLPWPLPASYTVKALVIAIFCCICVLQFRKNRWLIAAWLLFILPLLPVLGFFQNGAQSHAARFTYLPGLALSICAASLFVASCKKYPRYARFLTAGIVALLLLYCAITLRHLAAWKNSETLWSRVISIQPIGRAYYLRADYLSQKGRYGEAADDLLKSINIGKGAGYTMMFNLHALRGDALRKGGQNEEAVREFTNAIALNPYPNYFYHRGLALKTLGRVKEAEADFLLAGDETGPIEWRGEK